MSDIKFYLTSVEPNLTQTIGSQSLGGYHSTSMVYPETTLAGTIGLYDTELILTDYTNLSGVKYLSIGSEIMEVRSISSNNVKIQRRGINNIINVHISSDEVRGITVDKIFNNSFNQEYKQYRCIAVKNTSDNLDPSIDLTAYNMYIYLAQNSRNTNTQIKIALEIPRSQYIEGNSTSWTNISLIDTSLIGGELEDNGCKDAYLRILSGPNSGRTRLISSYDSSTGTFIFYESLPVDYDSSYNKQIRYEVEPAPAQRIKTGTESPSVNNALVTSFSAATELVPISVNVAGKTNGNNLYSRYIFYIWIERTMKKGSELFNDNSIIIDLKYSSVNG